MARRPKHDRPQTKGHLRISFLRAWREHRGLSQEALGAKTGMTQGMISHLEVGRSDFTGFVLDTLAEALDCAPLDLMVRHPKQAESALPLLEGMSTAQMRQAIEILKVIKRGPVS